MELLDLIYKLLITNNIYITGTAILRKAGYEVKNKDFFKIGIPFTLAAVISAYVYLWLVYGI